MWLDKSSKRWIFDHFKYATDKINREFVNPPAEYMEPCTRKFFNTVFYTLKNDWVFEDFLNFTIKPCN